MLPNFVVLYVYAFIEVTTKFKTRYIRLILYPVYTRDQMPFLKAITNITIADCPYIGCQSDIFDYKLSFFSLR